MPKNEYHDTPVVEFHEAFGVPVAVVPTVPELERRKLRIKLIFEELLELIDASGLELRADGRLLVGQTLSLLEVSKNIDLVEAADAITDLRYVVDGTSLEWGVPLEKCLREVHRSNMSKLGEDGKPVLRQDGKVLKGPGYTPPRLDLVLELHGGLKR